MPRFGLSVPCLAFFSAKPSTPWTPARRFFRTVLVLVPLAFAASACGSSSSGEMSGPVALVAGPQTPPQTASEIEAWIAGGAYKSWHCETAPHPSRDPSPHGTTRICSNDLTSGYKGTGERPIGSAGVKELYNTPGTKIVGYAVYVKAAATSAAGANWYWYERVPLDSGAPHDSAGLVADGYGSSGASKSICVGCHAAAGSDAAHTPTSGSADLVYTQLK
jgi:hypothetical protein